jgi:hypothetical protein
MATKLIIETNSLINDIMLNWALIGNYLVIRPSQSVAALRLGTGFRGMLIARD